MKAVNVIASRICSLRDSLVSVYRVTSSNEIARQRGRNHTRDTEYVEKCRYLWYSIWKSKNIDISIKFFSASAVAAGCIARGCNFADAYRMYKAITCRSSVYSSTFPSKRYRHAIGFPNSYVVYVFNFPVAFSSVRNISLRRNQATGPRLNQLLREEERKRRGRNIVEIRVSFDAIFDDATSREGSNFAGSSVSFAATLLLDYF